MIEGATVYIVDDDAAMRDSLALLLGLKGFRTQIFANAESLLRAYSEEWLGCILMDVRMPGLTGLELHAELRNRDCDLPIFIMSAYGDVPTARAALKAGAADFLEKPIDDDVLIDVLRSAIGAHSARRKAAPVIKGINRPQQLTMREQQVLDLAAAGYQVKQIAEHLGISPRTVEVYKSRMTQKLRANEPGVGPGPTVERDAN
jgi:two-component system, LuxR family, response regulator FixJ